MIKEKCKERKMIVNCLHWRCRCVERAPCTVCEPQSVWQQCGHKRCNYFLFIAVPSLVCWTFHSAASTVHSSAASHRQYSQSLGLSNTMSNMSWQLQTVVEHGRFCAVMRKRERTSVFLDISTSQQRTHWTGRKKHIFATTGTWLRLPVWCGVVFMLNVDVYSWH